MVENTNPLVIPQGTDEDARIGADQFSDTQESSPDTANDTSSSNYFKAQGDQPVIDNSSSLPFLEKDLAEDDEKFSLLIHLTSSASYFILKIVIT